MPPLDERVPRVGCSSHAQFFSIPAEVAMWVWLPPSVLKFWGTGLQSGLEDIAGIAGK